MSRHDEVVLNLDRISDILYVVREGYNLDSLVNIDSDKVPGFVKRIDPISNKCVGFMIYSFAERFSSHANCDEEMLKSLMDVSLRLTNEAASPTSGEVKEVAKLLIAA